MAKVQPNVVFVLADKWRAQAFGYAGDPNVQTPNIDRLAGHSLNFTNAVSVCPVCSPYRASLMTGQYPSTHGVFVNDVPLRPTGTTLGQAFLQAGYATAYIGKWHLDGPSRSAYIPKRRRLGFEYWKAMECCHDYTHSAYYAGTSRRKRYWRGFDASAQTHDAQCYIRNRDKRRPFMLMLAWGPPHQPIPRQPPPEPWASLYAAEAVTLRTNVPKGRAKQSQEMLARYYAYGSALDECVGRLMATVAAEGIEEDTIFVFTSDHGDMLGSQGMKEMQKPWDESIRVPFLLRYPAAFGGKPRDIESPINAPDILPTLLGLGGIPVPGTSQGQNFSFWLRQGRSPPDDAALIACYHPFAEWWRGHGGREYRGLRTPRYTYVRALDGPWLLYDNVKDPYQMQNLVHSDSAADLRVRLERRLQEKLDAVGDTFRHGMDYIRDWRYEVNRQETVPYGI